MILFEPHDNRNLYEAHIPEAMLDYDEDHKEFRKKWLVETTSMVMSPVDIIKPDFEVSYFKCFCIFPRKLVCVINFTFYIQSLLTLIAKISVWA